MSTRVTASPENENKILEMRRDGASYHDIHLALGIEVQTIKSIIARLAKEARERNAQIVDEAFLVQQAQLDLLTARTQEILDACVANGDWKEALHAVTVYLAVMTRRANLLGLDAQKTKSAGGSGKTGVYDWLADPNVSPQKLAASAKMLGLRVPEEFAYKVTDADMTDVLNALK